MENDAKIPAGLLADAKIISESVVPPMVSLLRSRIHHKDPMEEAIREAIRTIPTDDDKPLD